MNIGEFISYPVYVDRYVRPFYPRFHEYYYGNGYTTYMSANMGQSCNNDFSATDFSPPEKKLAALSLNQLAAQNASLPSLQDIGRAEYLSMGGS